MSDTIVWQFLAAALVIRLGFALYSVGLARSKSAGTALWRQVADISVALIAFWAIGGSIAMFDGNSIFGFDLGRLAYVRAGVMPGDLVALSQVVIVGGMVVAAAAERAHGLPLLLISAILGGVLLPVTFGWSVSNGWLAAMGYVGSGLNLHLVAAGAALALAWAVGPREGKYHRDGSVSAIPGHHLPLVGVGALVMLLGWSIYGVGNASAAMSRVFAAAAGATAGMLWSQLRYGKQDITLVLLALWGGLIASSAGQINHPFWAVLIGGSGGIVVIVVMFLIDLSMRIDDPTSVVAVHGAGALWGAMIGSIARDLPWADRLGQLGLAALASVVFLTLGFLLTWLAAIVLKRTTRLKVHEADQFEGLDLVEHDLNAYPDFQQTMIKSYHMREA